MWLCAKPLQWYPTPCNRWTVAHQAPLSMGFSRQEYRSSKILMSLNKCKSESYLAVKAG